MFGFDAEQGAKAFCIAEMFIGYLHTLVVITILRLPTTEYFRHVSDENASKLSWTQVILMVTYVVLTFGLVIQAVCGILLYFIGYRRKNIKMMEIWMFVAIVNFTCPPVLTIFGYIGKDDLADKVLPYSVSWVMLYMLYIDIGLATVGNYIKHLHKQAKLENSGEGEQGGAGPDDSKPKDEAPEQSEKSVAPEA